MQRVALLLSIVAAALAAWCMANQRSNSEGTIDDLANRLTQVETSMSRLSEQMSAFNKRGVDNAMLSQDPDSESSNDGGPFPTLGHKRSTLRMIHDTDKAIFKQLAELRRDLHILREESKRERASHTQFTPFHSVADVASALNLDETQVREVESVLADAKDELDRLRDEPNESGDSMRSLEELLSKALEAPGSNIVTNESGLVSAQNLSRTAVKALDKISTFPESTLTGRNQTYRKAARKIRDQAFSRIENTMTDGQRKKWRSAYREPLLPVGDVFLESNAVFSSDAGDFEIGK